MEAASAAPSRPLRADAQRNRERILAAAKAVFAEYGADAQMEQIARKAEVGVGTVYRHYPTKEALVGGLIAEQFWRFVENARASLEVEDPWEAFAGTLRKDAESMAANRVVRDVMTDGGPSVWAFADEPREELIKVFGKTIRRAQKAGVVRKDLKPPEIGMLMRGVCITMTDDAEGFDWRRHLEVILDGCRPR